MQLMLSHLRLLLYSAADNIAFFKPWTCYNLFRMVGGSPGPETGIKDTVVVHIPSTFTNNVQVHLPSRTSWLISAMLEALISSSCGPEHSHDGGSDHSPDCGSNSGHHGSSDHSHDGSHDGGSDCGSYSPNHSPDSALEAITAACTSWSPHETTNWSLFGQSNTSHGWLTYFSYPCRALIWRGPNMLKAV